MKPAPGTTGRRSFPAQYAGTCATCAAAILPGDALFYAPGNEAASGVDCCGDKDDLDLMAVQRHDDGGEGGDLTVDAATVMPRGRTARDACGRCFLVPASNGACGCDA